MFVGGCATHGRNAEHVYFVRRYIATSISKALFRKVLGASPSCKAGIALFTGEGMRDRRRSMLCQCVSRAMESVSPEYSHLTSMTYCYADVDPDSPMLAVSYGLPKPNALVEVVEVEAEYATCEIPAAIRAWEWCSTHVNTVAATN